MNSMLKDIPIISDPCCPPDTFGLIAKIKNPAMKDKPFTFYVYEDHLVILSEAFHTNIKTKVEQHVFSQREFPIEVARWILIEIEEKFMRGPGEGGLPPGEFSDVSRIDGEDLQLLRGECIGGKTMPGYKLVNLSRPDHDLPFTNQSFMMGDDFLFEYGLFDLWKDIAERHERGEF